MHNAGDAASPSESLQHFYVAHLCLIKFIYSQSSLTITRFGPPGHCHHNHSDNWLESEPSKWVKSYYDASAPSLCFWNHSSSAEANMRQLTKQPCHLRQSRGQLLKPTHQFSAEYCTNLWCLRAFVTKPKTEFSKYLQHSWWTFRPSIIKL